MNHLNNLFDSFYSKFVLRDFFGKIVPGFILLAPMVLPSPLSVPPLLSAQKTALSVFGWLVLLGFAWLVGFGIQSLAEAVGLIEYYPRKNWMRGLGENLFRLRKPSDDLFPRNDDDFYEMQFKFQEKAKEVDYVKNTFERLVVIKEACGNGYVSLLLAILIYVFTRWGSSSTLTIPGIFLVLAFCLCRMHLVHSERQQRWVRRFIDR